MIGVEEREPLERGIRALRDQGEKKRAATLRIPGSDFSRAVLSVWLGRSPPDDDLKAGLLGK